MDFVGDYRTKSKMAEALRKRETAMQTAGSNIDTGPIVTQAQGAFPGQVQMNWAAPLAQMGAAYFANKAGKKAETAEAEAETARYQALQNMMGEGGEMTPAKLLQLEQLKVDPRMAKLMMKDEDKLGAIAQAGLTRPGRAMLVMTGKMTQEQADAMNKQEDELHARGISEQEAHERLVASLRPGDKPSDFELKSRLYDENREKYFDMYGKDTTTGGAKATKDREKAKQSAKSTLQWIGTLKSLSKDQNIASPGNQFAALLDSTGSPTAGFIGSYFRNKQGMMAKASKMQLVVEQAKALAPVSNVDISNLLAMYGGLESNPESFGPFIEELESVFKKIAEANDGEIPELNAPPPNVIDVNRGVPKRQSDDLDSEIESLYR